MKKRMHKKQGLKEKGCSLLLVFLLLLGMTACAAPETGESSVGESSQEESSLPSKEDSGKPDNRRTTGIPGVYQLGENRQTEAEISLSESGGVLLYQFIRAGMSAAEIDLMTVDSQSGEELGQLSLKEGSWLTGRLEDGGFYCLDCDTGTLTLYDAQCRQTGTDQIGDNEYITAFLLSPDGTLACYASAMNGQAALYDRKAGAPVDVSAGVYTGEILAWDGTAFLFHNPEGSLYRMEANGTVTDVNRRPSAHLVSPYLVETNRRGYILRTTTSPELQFFAADAENEYMIAGSPDAIAGTTVDGLLKIYDLKGTRYTDGLDLGQVSSVCFAGDGTAVVLAGTSDGYATYVLKLEELTYTGRFSYSTTESPDDSIFQTPSGDAELLALVEQIEQEFGVQVFFDTVEDDHSVMFYVCPPTSEDVRLMYTQAVYDYLSLLPEGMIREAGEGQELWLYISDAILEDGEVSSADGFCSTLYGHPLIVVEGIGSERYFSEVLAHECMHFFDNHIAAQWLEDWDRLSPEGSFAMSYQAQISMEDVYYEDPAGAYFLESYSKTFPTEDRAVMAQKLYASYRDGKLYEGFSSPKIREKADYLCRMLRANFTSCQNAEELYWEKYLTE